MSQTPYRRLIGITTLVVMALLGTLSLCAQTNTSSLPAGFVRVLIPTNSEVLISVPFDLLPSSSINDAFYGQLTGSTNESGADVVRKWEPLEGSYHSAYKAEGAGEPDEGPWLSDFSTWSTSSLSILPGEGFFIGNRQSTTQTLFLCGLVVLDEDYAVPLYSGFNLFGNPYPSSLPLNASALVLSGAQGAYPASDGDQVSDTLSGMDYWLLSDTNSPNHLKWVDGSGSASALSLDVGNGFWYWRRGTNSFDWSESRPYTDPFTTNSAPPAIQDMYPSASQDQLTLDIQTTGDAGELLEVYYKDLAAADTFTSLNWLIAVTDIETSGNSALNWTDAGSSNRPAVNTVHSRYYLVGRGDIDQDNDDLPDSRETFVHGTDASRYDTDGDTLGDGAELATYGTDPLDADSDHDGIKDGSEVGYGKDPAVSNTYSVLPFIEYFETNTVTVGELSGQNLWEAEPLGCAFVQTNVAYEGAQALEIASSSTAVTVRHLFASPTSSVVWVDLMTQAFGAAMTNELEGSVCMAFSAGQLHAYDGYKPYTNRWTALTNHTAVEEGQWVRLTTRSDYASQEWLVCLDGVKLAEGLGFASDTVEFSSIMITGAKGYTDNIRVTSTMPEGISIDGDTLPDLWEIQHFGSTTNTDSGDPDNDGFSNFDEYLLGTNPLLPDSDGDGLDDGTEVQYGKSPTISNSYQHLPFVELFETDTVQIGPIHGQNLWEAAPTNSAFVQTHDVYAGDQAMGFDHDGEGDASVRHLFVCTNDIVWMDVYRKAEAVSLPTGTLECATLMLFNDDGYLQVYDGSQSSGQEWIVLSNAPAHNPEDWVRLTTKADYAQQEWLVCMDGSLVTQRLGFASAVDRFTAVDLRGRSGSSDNLTISLTQPVDLDMDADGIEDSWEDDYFGSEENGDPEADADNDDLSNLDEYLLGTNPLLPDSDGDGLDDGIEIEYGKSPSTSNAYTHLPFVERFETNTCEVGSIHNQNNWESAPTNSAYVQTNVVYEGDQALEISAFSSVNHLFVCTNNVIWLDFYTQAEPGALPTGTVDVAGALYFNGDGYLVVCDGSQPSGTEWTALTNSGPFDATNWVRMTIKVDYDEQKWLVYLDNAVVATNLGFVSPQTEFIALTMDGRKSYADNVTVSLTMPDGVDFDGDGMGDTWEWQIITNNLTDAIETIEHVLPGDDYDEDGMSNVEEYQLGSNPTIGDFDEDGIPDWWELQYGLDPTNNADASLDADEDGLSNVEEFQRGFDPNVADGAPITIYVNTAVGDDANYGIESSGSGLYGPVRTIGRAIALALDGDTVAVEGGSYPEIPFTYDFGNRSIAIQFNGTVTIE